MAKTKARRAAGEGSTVTPAPSTGADVFRAKIRMYRHGLGDCFLITLPRTKAMDGRDRAFIMIDCGLILGTDGAANKMKEVVADINATTGGVVDLLVVTHEHWDHVSGFVQAREELDRIRFENVWFGWTEDPDDPTAKELVARRSAAVKALVDSSVRLRAFGADGVARSVDNLLGFFGEDPASGHVFGAAGGHSTRSALDAARALGRRPGATLRYCRPAQAPEVLKGTQARLYVLGPPEDKQLLRTSRPSTREPETYGLDEMTDVDELSALFLDEAVRDPVADDTGIPFGPLSAIPYDEARKLPFFAERYWGNAEDGGTWRRIDDDWVGAAADFALRLDNDTNNTSLVLAIELDGSDVLLFAADAQVGNWLSWQNREWSVNGRTVTGPDLLKRTVFYKVGHHGSHNATLRQKGLEEMVNLRLAMIPVDQEMARKKNWERMPLPELITALIAKTGGHVVRSDAPAPSGLGTDLRAEGHLYYEYTLGKVEQGRDG